METYSFSKLKKIKTLEPQFSKYSEVEKAFGFFISPTSIFNTMFDQYIQKNNKEFLSHLFYWDLEKTNIKNISDLFSIIDNSLYLIKSFDHIPVNIINPLKEIDKVQCFSKDTITISFTDLINERLIQNFSFKRDNLLKLNLHNFISSIEEYLYNKKIKVSYKYSISSESLTYVEKFKKEIETLSKYNLEVFSKLQQNISFYLESDTEIIIPSNDIEESVFLNQVEIEFLKKNIYVDNLLFLKKYKESNSIEYLMAINHDFQSYKIKTPISFDSTLHLIMDKIFSFFWKNNEK